MAELSEQDRAQALVTIDRDREELSLKLKTLEARRADIAGKKNPFASAFTSAKDKGLFERDAWPPREALLTHEDRQLAMPRGELAILVGEGGIGKSWALLQLAVCVATGREWLGYKVPTEAPGGVAVIMAEEESEELLRRLHIICRHMNLSEGDRANVEQRVFPFGAVGNVPKLVAFDESTKKTIQGEGFPDLEQLLKERAPTTDKLDAHGQPERGWSLIICDPLVKFLPPGSENDNTIASAFVDVIVSWPKELPGRPTMLFAHPTNKSSRSGGRNYGGSTGAARGATALTDSFRCQLNLWAEESATGGNSDDLFLAITKSNYGPKGERRDLIRIENAQGMFGRLDARHKEPTQPKTRVATTKRELEIDDFEDDE